MGFSDLWEQGEAVSAKAPPKEPPVSTSKYLAEESKLVPAGLVGLPVETVANALKLLQAGAGSVRSMFTDSAPPEILNTEWTPRGGVLDMARLLKYEHLKAPSNEAELAGDVGKGILSALALRGKAPPVITGASGGLAGAGAFTARQLAPDQPALEMVAGQAAGMLPAVSPTANAARIAKDLMTKEGRQTLAETQISRNKPKADEYVKNKTISAIAEELAAEPTAEANMAETAKLAAQVPGVKPDLGQASQVGSVAQRAKAAARFSPEALNEKAALDAGNRAALVAAVPKAEGADVPFTRMLGEQQNRLTALSAESAQAAETAKAASVPKIQTREDLADAGAKLKAIRGEEKAAADKEVAARSAKLDEVAGNAQFPVEGIVSQAESVLGQPIAKFDPANSPKVVQVIKAVLNKPTEGGPQILGPDGRPIAGGPGAPAGSVGIKELRAMREAVNQDIQDVANSPAGVDRRQFRALTKIKVAIDDAVEASGNNQVAQAFREFNKYYATEYAPRFLRGENQKQTFKTPLGVDSIADENLVGQYLKPGSASSMKRFVDLYGQNPQAMSIMEDSLFARYSNEVIKDGLVDPKAHSKFMFNYGAQLKQLGPRGAEVQKQLNDRAGIVKTALDRQASLDDAMKTVQSDAFVNSLKDKFGQKSVDTIMGDVTNDPRVAATLTARMTTGEAKGMVNWFADDLGNTLRGAPFGKMGDTVAAKLADKGYSAAYRMALDKAFGKDAAKAHLERLDAIQKLAGKLDATEVNPFAGLSGDAVNMNPDALSKAAGFTSRTVFNLARATIAGRTSPEDAAFVLGTQFGTHKMQQMTNEVTRKILTDPKMSEAVLEAMKNPKGGPGWWDMTKQLGKYVVDTVDHAAARSTTGALGGSLPILTNEAMKQEGR